jgi:hypothetical protein
MIKGKHLFNKFIVFLLLQNLMFECRHLGFCRYIMAQHCTTDFPEVEIHVNSLSSKRSFNIPRFTSL